jgi:hypothetical protein
LGRKGSSGPDVEVASEIACVLELQVTGKDESCPLVTVVPHTAEPLHHRRRGTAAVALRAQVPGQLGKIELLEDEELLPE